MKISVIVATGEHSQTINGTVYSAQDVELVEAWASYDKALARLRSANPPDVQKPEEWGVRALCVYEVEVKE